MKRGGGPMGGGGGPMPIGGGGGGGYPMYSVLMRGLPFKASEEDIRKVSY